MGIRSGVGLCVKREHLPEGSELGKIISKAFEIEDSWPNQCDAYLERPEGLLIYISQISWNPCDNLPHAELVSALNDLPDEDYLLLEACYDYPSSEENCIGEWFENPWGMRRSVLAEVRFDGS